jgi:hypothetical protein
MREVFKPMDVEWLTYREAAKRLGSNIEAVRQRAIRCRWPRVLGNDKRARVQIPEGVTSPLREGNDRGLREENDRPPRRTDERAYDRPLEGPLIKALEAHVETLKEQLAAAEARLAAQDASLAAEQAKTEKAIAAFSSLADRLDVLAAERARPWWRRIRKNA